MRFLSLVLHERERCRLPWELPVDMFFMYTLTLQEGQSHILRAPMPGVVKSISCEPGDSVEEGTNIVTLEAMKMQNPLFAPMTGKVCS